MVRTRDAPPHGSQRKGQHHLDVAPHLLGLFLISGMLNVATVTTAPWFPGRTRKPTTHHQWSRCSGIRGRCLRSLACPARLPDAVTSAPSSAAPARISWTLSRRPNHRQKWNVPNQCLSTPPTQVFGRWHDSPAWPKFALGQWARHVGLLRAYRNERRSPPTCGHLWISCTTPQFLWCQWHRRQNPLYLANGFHLAIAKLLAKFDAIPLLESFRPFRRK